MFHQLAQRRWEAESFWGLLGSANIFHQLPGREGETQPQQKKTGFVETSNIFQAAEKKKQKNEKKVEPCCFPTWREEEYLENVTNAAWNKPHALNLSCQTAPSW